MNLLLWDVRGLHSASMHPEIKRKISQLHLLLIGLIETKIKSSNIPHVRKNSFGLAGGITQIFYIAILLESGLVGIQELQ